MKNFIFKKLIGCSLALSSLMAEDDGFFIGASYQTSLAIQRVDNPGLNVSHEASNYIRQNAVAMKSAAVPLAYYLDAMGQQTRVLMQMLCPDPSKRCLLYAGGYVKQEQEQGKKTEGAQNQGKKGEGAQNNSTGNNPPRGNVNATYDMQSLVNNLDKLTSLIGETLTLNPKDHANAKTLKVKLGNQNITIALPEGIASVMDALNNDITTALTTLWYNQSLTNKSFNAVEAPKFSPQVLQHLLKDGLANSNGSGSGGSGGSQTCNNQSPCATEQANSIASNAQNIFQALMQSIILGGIPNEKQFGFTYNTPPNGASGYQSFSGPGYYTKNSADNDGQQNQTPIGIKDLPAGAVVGTGTGQYTYHPSSAVYYVASNIIKDGITASMLLSGMQSFANKAAQMTGTSSYEQMKETIDFGENLMHATNGYGQFITNWVAPYLNLKNKDFNLPSYGGQFVKPTQSGSSSTQTTPTPQQIQQEQQKVMQALQQAVADPTNQKVQEILKSPYSPTARALMSYGLYRSQGVISGVVDEMKAKVNKAYQVGFARNFLVHNSNSNNMNGFGVKMGYKQFFGKKRMFGLRYYGFYDFGYVQFGANTTQVKANLSSYGGGIDLLYNVFTRKRGTEAMDIGFFLGTQYAAQTWKTNFINQVDGYHTKPMNTSFQFLIDMGIRTNFSKIAKQRKSRFSQGVEFGLKVPILYHTYYKSEGVSAKYKRAFSFYVGYNIGF
ncbi:outer membrane protein [Helicobacter cetorum]|uniref:Outer membrane protein HopI n=1 Tax=Helicobacter cetorum (strain ATCC BAA-540 / CCUG 52418 / MIT 99-5656) TaxID=1163745 RepID=I0ET90_HELCM|nr:outer membrane protein [Helicobacter cetorum]AFI06159.1 hypothetical protein HCD_05785 [Helicobacter cetorum MIT 99-5656]